METYGYPENVHVEAERIIDYHVWGLCNEIEDAFKLTAEGAIPRDSLLAVDWDDVANVYPDPSDWGVDECLDWARDYTSETDARAVLLEYDPCWTPDEGVSDDAEEALRDYVRESAHPAEPFQWFRVSSTLASWLDDIGECVVEWGNGWAWGRCTYGQSVILDGTFQRIARNLLKARGEDF